MSDAMQEDKTSSSTSAESDLVVLADGKVKKKILKKGTQGKDNPPDGAQVKVHYTGRLLSGEKFDSSVDRNEPFEFKLGAGQVIKGWDVGVASMVKGEKALLTIAPDYAYGASGSPPKIPGNATLEFEVELLDFELNQKVTEDGGVRKRVIAKGSGYTRPNDGATVTVTYSARVKSEDNNNPNFENVTTPHTFVLGNDLDIISGLEESIKNMYKEEESVFTISSEYAYGEKGNPKLGIKPYDTLEYTIKLIDFTKGKETWEMSNEEKMDVMTKLKEQGNHYFKAGDNEKAVKKWQKSIKVVSYDDHWSAEEKQRKNAIKVTCHSNLATLWAKAGEWEKVLTDTKEGLALDPTHVKCLYRRAQALIHTDQFIEAEQLLKKAKEKDPTNKEIERELANLKARLQKIKEKERAVFGGWFNKVKLVDDKELEEQKKRDEEQKKRDQKKQDEDFGDSDDDEEQEEEHTANSKEAKDSMDTENKSTSETTENSTEAVTASSS